MRWAALVPLADRPASVSRSVERGDARSGPQPRTRPPARLNGRIPRDLETICLRCLEKTPNRRYRSAESVAGDLSRWLEGRPIMARRVSPTGHAWRLCRRHPAVAVLVVTLAMTLVTGVVGLFVLLKQAEAERARFAEATRNSEAYEQFSASAADQLGHLVRTALNQGPGVVEQLKAILLKLRSAAIDLTGRGIVPSSSLGILEMQLGEALMGSGTAEEARNLLNRSAADLKQSLAKNPEDKLARNCLIRALFFSGRFAEGAGQLDDALNWFEQAAAIQPETEQIELYVDIMTALYKRLQDLADLLGETGRREQKQRARHACQKILRYLLGSEFTDSTYASPPGLETLGRLFHCDSVKKMSSHEDNGIRSYERFVADWLVISAGQLSPFRSSSYAEAYDRDPEAGAVALISAIRDRCSKLGLAETTVPAAINIVREEAVGVASEQRRLGRLGDAHTTVARLMVLARQLVQEYPNSAYSHRVLSEAYDQIKKNAFETNDDKLILEALGKAVEAAQRAFVLDPDGFDARSHLEKLTKKLADIKADRNASASSLP